MPRETRYASDPVRAGAEEDRSASAEQAARAGADGSGREDAGRAPGRRSAARHAWGVSLAMVAAFVLAAVGITFGPRELLWAGVGLFFALGVYSLVSHTWTHYVQDARRLENENQ
jgi:hypothetical protein